MFLNLIQAITNGSNNFNERRFVCKVYDTTVIPRVGELITDTAYKEPYEYKVTEVNYEYDKDICTVYLEEYILSGASEEEINEIKEMFIKHNWKEQ